MSKQLRIYAATICVIAGLAASGFAIAQNPTESIQAVSPQAVAEFWTDDRVRSAQPYPFYIPPPGAEALSSDEPVGPAGAVAGGRGGNSQAADLEELVEAVAADVAAAAAADAEPGEIVPLGTANVSDSDFVNKNTRLLKQYPYRTIGKLLFTTASGGNSYCSASVISPNNIIVTAAHCCHNRTKWHSNWAFVPAMRNTTRPYGTFPWASARILTAWITNGTRDTDVCVLTMGPNEKDQKLSKRVGWLGRSWNFSNVQHHFAFGYPSNIDSGLYKYEASAESYANCGNNLVNAMGSPMTFGSSGGPWIRVFKRYTSGAMNYVNTVVSGYDGCTGAFGQSFNGARFTSNNIVPLCTDEGC
ncbi:MAG TPA: trypsin-like serine protease [Vicinamibacterales bacterium]|nr:trypsin-like serine protease [Vicinamibacterales bacterium]